MIILHGENIILSRKRLEEITKNFLGEVVYLSGKKINLGELKQSIESRSLFGQDRLVIIEDFFSRSSSKEKELIFCYFKENISINFVLWEGKKIDGRSLMSFQKAKIYRFDLTSSIFKFLDSLEPGNSRQSLNLLHQSLVKDTPEAVFYMLIRQSRLLLQVKDSSGNNPVGGGWQQNKLIQQAKKFTFNQLLFLHRELLKIDWLQKTGRSPFSLICQLDLLVTAI